MEKRRLLVASVTLLALYAISYFLVSRKGFYEPVVYGALQGRDGHAIIAPKASFGYIWIPFEGYYDQRGIDGFGWVALFYLPVVAVDRATWHRPERVETLRYRTKNYFDYEKLEYSQIQ